MAASNFEASLALVLRHEGGFSDHPADPGGATNLGITRATLARVRGRPVTVDEVRALTPQDAAAIYRRFYWDPIKGNDLPSGLDHAAFDCAVNAGVARAAKLLQRVLRVPGDGVIGPGTLAALAAADAGETIRRFSRERLSFLQRLPTWRTFGRGWKSRVAEVEREALAMATRAPGPGPERPNIQKGPKMNDVKSIFASRTLWANVIGLAATALAAIGVDTGNVDANKLAEAAAQLVAAGSFIGSTVFRLTATKRLLP